MNLLVWLMRARKWAQRPPSTRQVVLVLSVIAICIAIVLAEWLGLWPDWARMQPGGIRIPR
ncbi:MAG: hypothetical protein Q4G22_06985 [Paracoccus sp. (in: a-proteobacteria)]|uniref:hypothetical protein n=1 Tax=Paracoccus sp. TaxID=267 RepID=UPI0026E022DF|nr:hypothetical protein [Paracoccus sp. (in: a-proteobacteria)]MDO5631566.1 hypothetical protein [Paracoccus sp. (in: a-proteobacteria)]